MMRSRILLVCPEPDVLASLTKALAHHFPVLAASTAASALCLIDRHGPCQAAFCQVFDDPVAGMDFAAHLRQVCPGIAVVALTRSPCPDALLGATLDGTLRGICLLPLSPESFCDKARHLLTHQGRRVPPLPSRDCQLTRAELDFLLGRVPGLPCPTAS